jgi:predicted acyltransferase
VTATEPEPVADAAPALTPTAATQRADALDALRGVAILGMALSGYVPRQVLPAWMYHAQLPPPEHIFDRTLPGLTWVDLVFPFFLFSMGAAFPLALGRRLDAGDKLSGLAGNALRRGGVLLAFALYVQAINPYLLANPPGAPTWGMALLGFALLFPALARLPRDWPTWTRVIARVFGWTGCAGLMVSLHYADGSGFSWQRSDIIIVVLANTVVTGSFLWLVSRHNWTLRMLVMLGLLGLRLARDEPGWVQTVWGYTPNNQLYQLYFQQYLLVVIPGTLAGDLLRAHLRGNDPPVGMSWGLARRWLVGMLTAAVLCGLLIGYQARWTTFTPIAVASGLVALLAIARDGLGETGMLRRLLLWGACFVALGMVFEPYEGGIKKDPSTVSYYLLTAGMAFFALVLLHLGRGFVRRRLAWLLIDSGRNPMIAYVAIRNLIPPVLGLIGVEAWLLTHSAGPCLGLGRAMGKTLLVALAVCWLTRRRIYWRT